MTKRQQNSSIYLPPDFIYFIDKNYETVFEIQEKIKQLYASSSEIGRNLLKDSEQMSFESSTSSDQDVSKIISAKLVPKSLLMKSCESFEIVEKHIKEWEEESFDSDKEYLAYLANRFPLVFLSDFKNTESGSLIITGTTVQYSTRLKRSFHKIISQSTNIRNHKSQLQKKKVKRNTKREKNNSDVSNVKAKTMHSINNKKTPVDFPSLDEIALQIYNRYFVYQNNLQLTLPPLHSSVLTLLGQRSPTKTSPRNVLLQGNQNTQSSTTSKHKKLRRHGRRHKTPSQGKEVPPSTESKEDREFELKSGDDPSITQLGEKDIENSDVGRAVPISLRHRKSLLEVVNENLAKTSKSYYKDMANLDQEIVEMKEKFVKKNIVLNSAKISMKEDTWLALPRTWSHSSATFSIPGDSEKLKSLSPLEYLQRYVTISEPRKHLYSLVFRRYRTLENPTGTTITTQVVQKALSEVMGQTLNKEDIKDLLLSLNINSNDHEINEFEFHGICAFCERIYSKYSLEKCNECYYCSKYTGSDKSRCHQNQKSLIEQTDFEYLSSKIRDNAVGPNLKRLIQSLCETHNIDHKSYKYSSSEG